jgi:beta-glucosidase
MPRGSNHTRYPVSPKLEQRVRVKGVAVDHYRVRTRLLIVAGVVLTASIASAQDPDTRARDLVSQMTLDEKIQELHGTSDPNHYRVVVGIPRLGIPDLTMSNGPAGVTNGGPGHQGPATAMPAAISLAATWDVGLAYLYGATVGSEAADLANGMLEAPTINIARVPENGRTFEAYGEDPYLVGQISVGYIRGVQDQGVIANVKHYAGNNQERNRGSINDDIDERTLREIYLPAFEASVTQGQVWSLMCAYNKVNGPFSCQNDTLMNQILKAEWGFTGFVISDFGAVHSTVPSALAGLDLEMPTGVFFGDALKAAVQAGDVPMSVIDDKLIRRFRTMIAAGVFDNPPSNQPIPVAEDGATARMLAEQGMVLLKNDQGTLPLDASHVQSIAVIGPYAARAMTGGGGSARVNPLYTIDPVPGIQNRVGPQVTVNFADGSDIAAAAALAQSADVAIVMVGDNETEGQDHPISLSGNQDQLVAAVAAANPNTVVVVKSGSAVLMPWVDSVPAILEAWYPGEEDGNAVAAVLFGDFNPSGKLPLTFPRRLEDLPANTPEQYPGVNGVAHYSEGVFVGYRHYDSQNIDPLFAFGHGLSYTSFSYDNLVITPGGPAGGLASGSSGWPLENPDDVVSVALDVTNTGSYAGGEAVQLYVGMPSTDDIPQPPEQLKRFQKVSLNPGETTHVQFVLDRRAFSYWDVNSHGWLVAPGTYQIMVGSSSRDIRLVGQITQ